MNKTPIEYLDYTWNPIAMRCDRCSPGCLNCWHLRTADRLCKNPSLPEAERLALAGKGPFILRERELSAPLRLKKPSVIGVQFMGDLFHEGVPWNFIYDAYKMMAQCDFLKKGHTFLILTKRPDVMLKNVENIAFHSDRNGIRFQNIYHGLTVCNQDEWNRLGPIFMQVPGKKFLSHEPALGQINYGPHLKEIACLISGGETGPGARPTHPDVFRSDRDQCAAAGVPYFHKQNGEWLHESQTDFSQSPFDALSSRNAMYHVWPDGSRTYRVLKAKAGRLLDGREWNDLPWVSNG